MEYNKNELDWQAALDGELTPEEQALLYAALDSTPETQATMIEMANLRLAVDMRLSMLEQEEPPALSSEEQLAEVLARLESTFCVEEEGVKREWTFATTHEVQQLLTEHQSAQMAADMDSSNRALVHEARQRTTKQRGADRIAFWDSWVLWGGWALAAVVIALFLWNPSFRESSSPSAGASAEWTAKGPMSFHLLGAKLLEGASPVSKHTKPRRIEEGEVLVPGELVQFIYEMPEKAHVMVVSINQRGEVFSFVPFRGTRSAALQKKRGVLPEGSSLELDDYVGYERFWFVASPRPFTFKTLKGILHKEWQRVGQNVRKMATLPLGWKFQTVWVQKRVSRSTP